MKMQNVNPESADEQLLFAVLVTERQLASPEQVAKAAKKCLSLHDKTLAERLVDDGIIDAEQRKSIEAEVNRVLSDQVGTVAEDAIPIGDSTEIDDPAPIDDTIGTVTPEQPGRYTIQGVHGRGGQARVLLAFDEHVGRDVALKEILQDRMDGESTSPWASPHSIPGVVRFLREARVTGQLEHPNIVPVYEVGRREDGMFYYTMRLVRGQTLAQKLDECSNFQDRIKLLGTFWDICKAIAYAHSRGVVHRDIKPSNVMVGEFGETVLLDWGIAKVRGKQDIGARDIKKELKLLQDDNVEKTTAGSAMGTPSYMSPEQARGEIDAIDERSDVWGLGAVLYEILTGHPPFEGKRRMEILIKVGRKPVKPVSELCPDAPRELAAITHKALHRNKEARYSSARELSDDIGAYMTGEKVAAYEYTSWELLKRFASQHKPAIIAVALILGVIIGALISVSLSLRAESIARQNEMQARKQEQAARNKERQERLVANYHLAQAYAEKADRLMADSLFLEAKVLAAASLNHNPSHPGSPFHDDAFDGRFPESHWLRVEAASQLYRADFHLRARLIGSIASSEVLTRTEFSPDGNLIASGSFDGSIHLWDIESGKLRFTLRGHKDRVYDVAFSSSGKMLVSAGHDGTVRVWDPMAGYPLFKLTGHTAVVQAAAFSPQNRHIASCSHDGSVRVWEVESRKSTATATEHKGKVNYLAFSPDGSLLATAGEDKKVILFEMPRLKKKLVLTGHTEQVFCVSFSPNGRLLASAGDDHQIRLWNPAKGHLIRLLKGHTDGILSLGFSPDGKWLASASYDQTVKIWDVDSGRQLLNIGHEGFVYGVAFSRDGARLVSTGYNKVARIWDLEPGRAHLVLRGHKGTVYSLAISPDGKILASAGWDKMVRLWDIASGKPLAVLKGHKDVVDGLAFAPDSNRLASASRDRKIFIWNTRRKRVQQVISGHEDAVYGVAFSPDGELLASSCLDNSLFIWDAETGKKLLALKGHSNEVDNVAFSPDGKWLASASHDKTVRIFNPRSGEQIRVLGGHSDWISGVDFSHDGKMLVSSGKDGLVIIWAPQSGREIGRLVGHEQWVNTAKFSPDDKLIATASDDRTTRIWSVKTMKPLLKIPSRSEVVAILFMHDGKSIALGDAEDVKIYPVDFSTLEANPGKLLAKSERAAGLELEGFSVVAKDD